ncbi:hypothetical protein [Tannerella forsythia]|uniref:Uncharacterized protein n=1 Tax=Tannerella forsythia TaxID=28112 RepID=A0A3P1Z4M0_TANFO|nr:hypothetical protein [Tannerella forsythia]RRD78302.1 hypothetical protein EII41_02465 [Tannerella forsythia]
MAINYLYIDDDSTDRANGTVQGLKKEGRIEVFLSQPESTWEQQIQFIEDRQKEDKLDGLIIDLRLDDYANTKDGKKANYRGTSLAQEIRTRQKEKSIKEFPIILFSANDKITQSLENSGRNLFDVFIEKESITGPNIYIEEYIPKLIALAEGYRSINLSAENLSKVLSIDISVVDERFVSELNNLANNPSHVIANFLINELLLKQGLLIDERTLAARLGIDIEQSSEDWEQVLSSLNEALYKGVFYQGWERWWMPIIEIWWNKTIHAETYLRATSASDRVEYIKKELKLTKIYPSEKMPKSDSDEFWTVCKGNNRPLDPVDGLMIDRQENLYPWQDPDYVSVEAALHRTNINIWKKVAKLEEERLKELQAQYRRER